MTHPPISAILQPLFVMKETEPQKQEPEEKAKNVVVGYMMLELGLEFAVILAVPLIGFIYLGKWLDARYGTKLFIIAGILLATTLSSYLIYKKINDVKKLLK